MLLKSYQKEIFRPECNPSFQSLHGIAHLDEDITKVLPYLNTVLGGYQSTREPPSITFKTHGKLIAVHPRQIAVNAITDEAEVDKILEWLKGEINYFITLCDNAHQACPVFPARTRVTHVGFDDPPRLAAGAQ